ncbi:probable LRR receptor-like serine/threonine-protein kinase at3g47570 [Phtheirospermum japonicum]|uniref:non-specific serine/threonine protein kinase n=1 Tax=Phtheirospermum japonicum TaxID=374723 RepID=A0A830CWS3_9LAMI|nr:probable LRR receptor-like serine/threonine-protein kinase at3g47570 [Phtheirospermum japonicum]
MLSLLIFSCFALLIPTILCNNQTDLTALLALKAYINVDPQGSLNSWNQTTHFCRWEGIQCGHKHPNRVVAINLRSQGLVGSLSPHVGNLSFLRTIILQNNTLRGPIPREIGRLRRLEYVELMVDNSLSGVIPPEFGSLYRLESLGLGLNELSGPIPESIGNLTSLMQLYLPDCGLKGEIPRSLTRLWRLRYLILEENNFTGSIPSGLFNISTINVFGVGVNGLEGSIPSTIGLTLPTLRGLGLGHNRLSGRVPISLSNASSLEQLSLTANSFTRQLPRFGGLSLLQFLGASSNSIEDDISSLVSSLTNCTNLQIMDVSENILHGQIPNTIANLSINLRTLFIASTQIHGEIPSEIQNLLGNLSSLTDLDVYGNNFTGVIPKSLVGSLKNLAYLDMSYNMLSEIIPNSLSSCISLERLYLMGNGNLCGGIWELNLPPCTSSKLTRKNNLSALLKITIPTATVAAALLCLAIFIYKRKAPNNNSPSLPSFFGILDDGQTLIAVKVLNLIVRGASKSFMAECNALRGIRHRNLVKILSICESIDFQGNDFKALIYEFNANGSLEKWLHHNGEREESDAQVTNLNMIQRLNIAIDIAEALQYLHCGTDSTIAHGDLKPSNILLDLDMTACVGDFGLARIISSMLPPQEGASSTTIGIKGTIGYVPPAGDVYSYGILVLEMFTNKKPTDDLFKDYVNLHNFVSAALQNHVMEIVDPLMIQMEPGLNNSKVEDCMASILRIGVSCSREIPRDRLSMIDVVNELHKVKSCFLT